MLRTYSLRRLSGISFTSCALMLCLALVPIARAENVTGGLLMQAPLLQVAERGISVQQAVELVRSQYKGQVVKATEIEFQGRPAYRIRLVNAGRVRDVLVDVQSGQIINARGNDG
ncbi:PepSY domain-containing protein [Marinobacterium sedimentorum]|uniref:PepSY domain-containing protein n=1 Tax=Marinobacterium sedimentorum TaxID=2927804 RepID=UPI0020C65951|nr:PepSY domain-containing protein [Marinobacterium sedimentorum]MCP8686277.1 PepSY domain-containing protein [Marinobacterium sedimentorum]